MATSRSSLPILICLILGTGGLPAASSTPGLPASKKDCCDPRRHQIEDAKAVAEVETGGEAVSARRIAMGGTHSPDGLGGIEVLVHMEGQVKGWRCLIDSNNMKLRRKEAIPNPPSKVR